MSSVLLACFPSSKSTPCVHSRLKTRFDLGRIISCRPHAATSPASPCCGRGRDAAERRWAAQGGHQRGPRRPRLRHAGPAAQSARGGAEVLRGAMCSAPGTEAPDEGPRARASPFRLSSCHSVWRPPATRGCRALETWLVPRVGMVTFCTYWVK